MALSQPGIFNALDYNLLPAALGGTASGNQTALQSAIYAAEAAGGGTVLIPSELDGDVVYPIQGPIYVGSATSPSPVAVIIAGTGQGRQSKPILQVAGNGDLFSVDPGGSGDQHIGGITFQDFSIEYNGGTSGTAIHALSGENIRVFRMVFIDTPQAIWFEDTLQCNIFECTVEYTSITSNPACITLGNDANGVAAKEVYIGASKFLASMNGGIGLVIQGAEQIRVTDSRIEGFSEGINIVPGAAVSGGHNTLRHHFSQLSVFTGNPSGPTGPALTIQPRGPQNISQLVFVDCQFEPAAAATSLGPGIYIDEGLDGSTIDNVRFVSCHSTRWAGPGIEITSGSNIEINGGFYAGNSSGSSPSGGAGGISITGPAAQIRIVGASCIGSYPYIQIDSINPSPVQDVGIYIAGSGANDVIIDHCDLTGNSENGVLIGAGGLDVTNVFIRNCNVNGYGSYNDAIDILGEVSNIQVTNCAGYNDQAVPLATSAPGVGTFSALSYNYYGPATFYGAGSSSLTVSTAGHPTGLANNSFTLAPGQTVTTVLGGGGHNWTTFLMVGQ